MRRRSMDLQIHCKNVKVPSGVQEQIAKKLDHLDRISRHIFGSELMFEEERGRIKGELIVRVKGRRLTAKTVGKDPLAVTTTLREKMESQLKKYEGKMKSR
jgi:ribosomal subunit interface protein